MEWQIVVAIVLGIPLVLVPVTLVWYLNVSGLYQVLRATRERQKRRAQALELARGKATLG